MTFKYNGSTIVPGDQGVDYETFKRKCTGKLLCAALPLSFLPAARGEGKGWERTWGSSDYPCCCSPCPPCPAGSRFQLHRVRLESRVRGSFVSPLGLRSFLPSLHNFPAPPGYKPDKTPDKQRSPCWAMRFQGKTDSVVARKMRPYRWLKYKNPENHSNCSWKARWDFFLRTRNVSGGWALKAGLEQYSPANNRRCGVAQPQLLRLQV